MNDSEQRKITVYFGCSMRGGDALVAREKLAEFPKIIKAIGCRVASDHPTQPGIIERERLLAETDIHDRDYHWLRESDLGIFEISNPSLGVGSEVSDMVHLNKPVLLLYRSDLEDSISAYLRGKTGSQFVETPLECYAYQNFTDAEVRIREFIRKYK